MARFKSLVKPWIVMPAVVVIALGGWGVVRSTASSTSAATQPSEQVVTVSIDNIAQTVSAQGTVEAARSKDLNFTSAGTVTAVNVRAGQGVATGDVLAEIDSSALHADVSNAEAALAQAEAKLADDSGASTTQRDADQASVTTAEDRVAEANKALDEAKLTAPFDGTIAQVNLTTGEELGTGGTGGVSNTGSATGSGRSGSTLGSESTGQLPGGSTTESGDSPHIQLITPSSFSVEVGIDGTDIDKVTAGQTATISLSTSTGNSRGFGGGQGFPGGAFPAAALPGGALPGGDALPGAGDGSANGQANGGGTTVRNAASVTGKVSEVSTIADASSGVAKYAVTLAFDDASRDYNPGATVDVRIAYAEKQNALLVPVLAVSTSDGQSTVTVTKSGSKETRKVATGLTSGGMIEITSGLRAGEAVVVALPTFSGAGTQTGSGRAPTAGGQTRGAGP